MKLPDGPKTPNWLRMTQFILRPTEFLDACQERYGDCFTVFGAKKVPMVYLGNPEGIQKVFTADASQFEQTDPGSGFLQLLLGENSVFLLRGDRHKRQRQLLTPPFHGDRMRAYGKLICEIAERVTQPWKNGQPFVFRFFMQEISLQVILRLIFGLDEGARFQQLNNLITTVMDDFNSPLTSGLFFFKFLQKDFGPLSPGGRFIRLKQQIDELIDAEISQRRENFDPNRSDILTLLMSAKDEKGQPMTDEELRDELMTLLLGGHETTATALAWAFYWLDRHPEVQEKLLEELSTINWDSDVSLIAKLPYLSAVCSETLRVYPIAIVSFVRVLRSPLQVIDYELPPGTILFPCIYLAHQRPEAYPEPKQFKPERFLEKQFSPYEYLPFGGGDRRCLGMAFALFEIKLVLATILSQYRLTLADNRPVRPVRRALSIVPTVNMRMVAIPHSQKIPSLV